jgi:D-glycero-alpha-D-manno-heptose-7-phosphate kinase
MRMESLVREGLHVLCSDEDLRVFGDLLHQGWMLKRQLSDTITTSLVDDAYDRARAAGAIGGKLLGAGGGGFLLVYTEPEHQEKVLSALHDLPVVPFQFEDQGSRLIFYRPRN